MSMTRYELTVPVLTSSPLHSGSVDEVVDRNRPKEEREAVPRGFARDGLGRPVLTGRSVKGALRAACSRYLRTTGEDLAQLWGGVEGPAATASALTFHTVDLGEALGAGGEGDAPGLPTRTGIAVDRYWGTAGDTALFAHEYLPDGRPLTLRISAQAGQAGPDQVQAGNTTDPEQAPTGRVVGPQQIERLFAVILGLLQAEQVAFGGRRNAGWGRVRLDPDRPWELRRSNLDSREGLLEWLDGGEDITSRVEPVEITSPTVRISITWDSPTGILVAEQPPNKAEIARRKAEREKRHASGERVKEDAVPTEPLRTVPRDGNLVLPGSSVRGALRSRASRIARTVLAARGLKLADWSEPECRVLDQLAQDPGLVHDLFGTTEHRGALTVLDTVAASRVSKFRIVTHNAGDRWTGGVAEGALYAEEVHDVDWNSIVLELDLDALPGGDDGVGRRRAAWCLLGLTLAELAAGTLPLGSRGTRGLGQVRVTALTVDGGEDIIGAPWDLRAPGDRAGQSIAAQVLDSLRALKVEPNPHTGEGWSGWSSYLVDSEEETHDD